MDRSIVFDTGPIISLATNNLLWILEPLKKQSGMEFFIPEAVKKEIIDRPLQSKRFKFEAMQVLSLVNRGIIKIISLPQIKAESEKLLNTANRIFQAKDNWLQIMHVGEMEAIAAAIIMNSSAFVVDERTARMLIENPDRLMEIMEKKLHTKISVDRGNLDDFRKQTRDIRLIRSTEIAAVAYEKGLLDQYIPNIPNPRKELLDSVLWGIKLNGCSISENEINKIVKIETKNK